MSPFPVEKLSAKSKINKYFSYIWGDFNLWHLLGDNLVCHQNGLSVPGITFLKRIPPKVSFNYILKSSKGTPKISISRIVVLKRQYVESNTFKYDNLWFYTPYTVIIDVDKNINGTIPWK